ncbi:MAG: leucine-rich repeat domain-containing protein [Candidatus Diapherotrites archaeon]|nr:leucine-rich repeat domain-containing protein [Candidatus Diapherotrites archaeon]
MGKKAVFLTLILVLAVLFSGCVTTKPDEGVAGLCSNSEYSTTYIKSLQRIGLTDESMSALSNKIKTQGNSALNGIADLSCLTELGLGGVLGGKNISDISILQGLTNLKALGLNDTSVSDISPLAKLTNLDHLTLSGSKVLDISTLSELTALNYLDLGSTSITDISPIKNLKNLEVLDMTKSGISDISQLKNLTNLKRLILYGTSVSEEDCKSLKKDMPNTIIICP